MAFYFTQLYGLYRLLLLDVTICTAKIRAIPLFNAASTCCGVCALLISLIVSSTISLIRFIAACLSSAVPVELFLMRSIASVEISLIFEIATFYVFQFFSKWICCFYLRFELL